MSLIKCPKCGKEISDRANSCPNCGCPLSKMTTSGVVKIKMPKTEQMATGWIGLLSAKDAYVRSNGKVLWHGKHGQTASFKIDKPTKISIDLGTWGNEVTGKVKPKRKYELVQDYGIHMKATFRLSEVDVIDSD